MGNGRHFVLAALCALFAAPRPAAAISGNSLALRTPGTNVSGSRLMNDNGYVGTYINVPTAGEVTVTVNASGTEAGGVAPRMNVVIADELAPFDVTPGTSTYQHTFSLPAGLHFVRTEFANDPQKTARALTVQSLDVAGATLVNDNTSANALAAADNYVDNFRRGPARLSLVGVDPGAEVRVELSRHDFHFGTAVGGTSVGSVNAYLNNANYSSRLLQRFNTITQGNAGKWAYNEGTRDVVTMGAIDRFFQYADQHNLDVRPHNMLWADSQQPGWASTLLNSANSGNATARTDLRTEISERIDYYVGDGDADPNDGDRARRYYEMDLLNEHVHQPKYWNVYGAAGIADVFNEAAAAVAAAGSNARLLVNEYNVLQYGFDNYGVWYREDVEELTSAGAAVSGIGVQYYPIVTVNPLDSGAHSPARIQQIFQNLSVTGLPITLSEFGVQDNNGATPGQAATLLNETMRMVFGTPGATTFMMWGFWANDVWDQAPVAALFDAGWNLTPAGEAYDALMNQWDTDLTLMVGDDGVIDFTGFYGDYDVTIDGATYRLSLAKGVTDYELVVALAGDFDGSGTVDTDDLALWNQGFNESSALGDADGDLDTDGADLLVWQHQLGRSVTPPAGLARAAAVPEPASTAPLLAAAILGNLGLRIKKRRARARRS